MENHPIPQDVTGFQFKLIGDMTIRQFAYLCGGVILAWIFYSAPLFAVIKLPIAFLFLLLGILLAFVPFEGRPLDQMIAHFAKALFAPNQYTYEKSGASFNTPSPVNTPVPAPTQTQVVTQVTPQLVTIQEPSLPTPANEEGVKEELQKEKEEIEKELAQVEEAKKEDAIPSSSPDVHTKLLMLEKNLEEALLHKKKLEEELASLQQKLTTSPPQAFAKPATPIAPVVKKQSAVKIPIGITNMADDPNVILGIVKDPRGNVLPNILVEVQDTQGNPVRAFKTNATGQFASATALKNGTYTIHFEDPSGKNLFDKKEVVVNGEIIEPIEAISQDQREELRKALFDTPNS